MDIPPNARRPVGALGSPAGVGETLNYAGRTGIFSISIKEPVSLAPNGGDHANARMQLSWHYFQIEAHRTNWRSRMTIRGLRAGLVRRQFLACPPEGDPCIYSRRCCSHLFGSSRELRLAVRLDGRVRGSCGAA